MIKYSEDLIRISRRMMTEKGQRYRETKTYLRTVMCGLDQLDLMDALEDLNIHELKQCLAAGVPGHAMHKANELLRKQKKEIQAYIEKKGAEASATVKIDQKEEEDKDVVEGIRPSKKRGEDDSGEMGDESTDSGA